MATDIHQLVHRITEDATEEKTPAELLFFGDLKGNLARAAKLTKKKKEEIAKKAAAARWKTYFNHSFFDYTLIQDLPFF